MRRLLLLIAVGLVACGADDESGDPLEFDHPSTKPVSACADASTEDAFVLALRYQSAINFNHRLASDYAWVLNSARAAYPALCEQRAFADTSPDVLLARPRDQRVLDAWSDGRTETGIAEVDAILGRVGVSEVTAVPHSGLFMLTLAQPVNARALARALDKTQAVDATPKDLRGPSDFYFDGSAYVSRSPSDIVIKSGQKATRILFRSKDGRGTASVIVNHNGTVGALEQR